MKPADLEALASRCLGRLPDPKAPRSLLPRVMDEVERARGRSWFRRAWRCWPPAWKAASVAVLAAAAVLARAAAERAVAADVPALVDTVRVLWRLVLAPNAPYLAASAFVMGLSCALACAAISRMLWERNLEP